MKKNYSGVYTRYRPTFFLTFFLFCSLFGGQAHEPKETVNSFKPQLENKQQVNCPQIWGVERICNQYITSFSVYSSGLTFQWQISEDQGGSWKNLNNNSTYGNVRSNKLDVYNFQASLSNNLYRLQISNESCTIFSEPFETPIPQITNHPENTSPPTGTNAIFEAEASGSNLSYRWQANAGSGSHWYDLFDDDQYSGTSTTRLTVKNVQEWIRGYRFRLYVYQENNCPVPTSEATILSTPENPDPCINGDPMDSGNNYWIGHLYDDTNQNLMFDQNFENYIGSYSEAISFDQNFGSDYNNFQFASGDCTLSIYTETFSARYRMKSSLRGLYFINIGSDDGSRLSVDGKLIYNNWNDHTFQNQDILINLSGNSELILDYYEIGGENRITAGEPELLIENILTDNLYQTLNFQNDPQPITGDVFKDLPSGITRNDTGYQWVYSTSEGGPTFTINGATGASFTPNKDLAPFNTPGTIYLYRIVKLSGNNRGQLYKTSIKSNPATVTVQENCTETPTVRLTSPSLICPGEINISGTFTGTAPWHIEIAINGQIFNSSFTEKNFDYPLDIQQNTTIEILNITDGNGCQNNVPNASITIDVIDSIENNRITGSQESCGVLDAAALTGEDFGEGYTYLWEASTTSEHTDFTPAPGINSKANYEPGTVFETTWYRRRIKTENCSDAVSNPVEITINSAITNNDISFFHGSSGSLQAIAAENQQLNLSAPEGTLFTYVDFTSYGTPTNNNGSFTKDEHCHAATSQLVSELYLLGEHSATIAATNQVFTDPCVGTIKRLYVRATYAEAFCAGLNPGTIQGTVIEGPNIEYQWLISTTGPGGNFSPAPGSSTAQNYNPGTLNQNIWLKREASSGGCSNESPVLYIPVKEGITWTGAQDTNWNNPANWSCNTLPTLQTNVLIPERLVTGNYPEIDPGKNALAKDLTIENSASVRVSANWLRIAEDLRNAGVLNTRSGSVSFEGAAAQIIPQSAFENNQIQNLRINNTSGVISEAIIEVTGTLKVEAGNFDTGNELTLISNEAQTALIDGNGNGEVRGLVHMQRYLDRGFGYKYFSSPFQNSVVGDFDPYMDFEDPQSGFPHFYRYEENRRLDSLDLDATGWEVYNHPGNNLKTAEGYALNFGASADAQTITLIGEVNNGVISPRTLLNHHREWTKGFHLVGNPYPSPIDWEASQGWTKNNIDDGIYFFTASDTSQYTGTYTAYVNNISTGDPLVDGRSSNIIPSMQGFFIKVSDSQTQNPVTGKFGMDNRVRVTDFDQQFLRSQLVDFKPIIRLEAGYHNMLRRDPMVIYFSGFSTPNFEKEMDAHKLMNTDPAVPSFYNITNDKKELAINAIPFPETKGYKKIPLGIKALKSGEMKINLALVKNLSPHFNIYLIDHVEGKGQNLRRNPEYSFSIKAGTHNSRFELMFSEEKITSPAIAFNEPFDVKVEDGKLIVHLSLEENQEGILRASTITGQILQIKEAGGKDMVVFEGITSDGVYIINLQLGKKIHAKKVLIKK